MTSKEVGKAVINDYKKDAAAKKELEAKKKSLTQHNNNNSWVELPICSAKGADKSEPLNENLLNASFATCKKEGAKYMLEIADQAMESKEAGKTLIEKLNKEADEKRKADKKKAEAAKKS